jgi:ABC-type multidrug transport system permease subunit
MPATQSTESGLANLVALVQKNLKLLVRARASALVVILGPLLVIFLAGLAFDNTNLYAVRIGTYSPAYNDLSNSFIDKLAEKQFKVVRYPAEALCEQGIRRGEIHTCILFPADFTIGKNGSNEIRFSVDYSQMNLVWTILNVMTTSISARSFELSRNLTMVLLSALDFTKRTVTERKQTLIALTTQNDEVGQRVANIQAEIAELELNLEPGEFGLSNLSSAKGIVKHWVDNSLSLGKQGLSEAQHFIDAAGELVSGSAAGSQIGADLAASLQASVDKIKELQARMKTTDELVQSEYAVFSGLVDHLAGRITQTKSQIDNAASAHVFTLDELALIQKLLDQALLNILTMQKSLNEIDKVIGAIQITDPESIVQPVKTTITPIVAERSYLNYLFPTLIALILLFTALLLAPTLIQFERNSPAYFRNYMTPTSDAVFLGSVFATVALLLLVQVTIVLAIAAIFFTQILQGIAYAAIVIALLISLFTFLGMIVGYLFNSEETAMLASITLGSIFLFISDIIIPLESMPAFIMRLAEFNPLVIGSDLLRRTILFDATFTEVSISLATLFGFTVLTLGVLLVVYYGLKKNAFSKYLARGAPKKEPQK